MGALLKILKALNSDQYPWQISLAVVFGMFVGLLPFLNFWTFLVIFLALVINVNFGIFVISATFFSILGFILDPLLHIVGKQVLTASFLVPLWTKIYNLPYARMTDFNNTVVMGALVLSFVLAVPVYLLTRKLIVKYREKFASFVEKYPVLKVLRIISVYEKTAGE